MLQLSQEMIRIQVADSPRVFYRGENIYENGDLLCVTDGHDGQYQFRYDGNYGDYTITIDLNDKKQPFFCDCPYPGAGCKHVVAALLTILDRQFHPAPVMPVKDDAGEELSQYLSYEEIKAQALEDRVKRAKEEIFTVIQGDMYKDEHLLVTKPGKQYSVVTHDPEKGLGHCSCPDFLTNRLGTCKHLLFLAHYFKQQKGFGKQVKNERFPFADIYWDSVSDSVRLFYDPQGLSDPDLETLLKGYFDQTGLFTGEAISLLTGLIDQCRTYSKLRIQPEVVRRVGFLFDQKELEQLREKGHPDLSMIRTELYPYQKEGVSFGLFRRSVLIGDEMGLGKTLQAIALCVLKKEIFGFKNALIVTLASLKDQWDREIRRFTGETPVVVAGNVQARRQIYRNNDSYFKITNYEAVLRDVTILSEMKPDIIILDEAQRIKNFNTKTADAVKQIPRQHALVLTGTPLENKLEDVYSIVQFLDRDRVSPLWDFAGRYFMMLRKPKGKIAGYTNLTDLKERLSDLVIRRKKEEVIKDLPETITNNYYIDMTEKQEKLHAGFLSSLLPLLNKKYLTPLDLQMIQMLLLKMRMVSNSTYLIDKKTHLSPKLKEFESIIHDLAVANGRKVVVFSEWTTMTFLIAKHLSQAGIPFVELSGKIPVHKRQSLIDEFTNNPACKVFLSTDAGGTGLNLQAADCVINFELPWNPAKLSQRTGRVNRIGQTSSCINVINLISKRSIEERIFSGLELKRDLFKGVFEDGDDTVEFTNEKRAGLLNRLRQMMGDGPDAIVYPQAASSEEIPEDTPHFLNPQVLREGVEAVDDDKPVDDGVIDFSGEETDTEVVSGGGGSATDREPVEVRENVFENQPVEKIEAVLNSGMEFIGGLLEMATGKKIEKSQGMDRLLTIDRNTGEVTMKFKLPGF